MTTTTSNVKKGSIFMARFEGDIFDSALRNDLLVFTDKPSQQILFGAKPSSDDDFRSPCIIIHDSNVEVPALLHLNNDVEINAPVFMNDSVTIDGDLQVNSLMRLVNTLKAGDAVFDGAITVTSPEGEGEGSAPSLYVESGEDIRMNERVVINGGFRVFPDRVSGPFDGLSDVPAISIENDSDDVVVNKDIDLKGTLRTEEQLRVDGDVFLLSDMDVREGTFNVFHGRVEFGSDTDVDLKGGRLRVYPPPEGYAGDATAPLFQVQGTGVEMRNATQLLFEGPADFEGERFSVHALPSAEEVFRVTDFDISMNRGMYLNSNLVVERMAMFRGDEFRVSPSPSGNLAFRVNDCNISGERDVRLECNVQVQGDFEVGRNVQGSTALFQSVPDIRRVKIDGEFRVDDSNRNLLRVSSADGIVFERETRVDSNLRVTDDLVVDNDMTVKGQTVLQDDLNLTGDLDITGNLEIDPTGSSVVFKVGPNDLDASRHVFMRSNLDVFGHTFLRSATEMRAGGSLALGVYSNAVVHNRRTDFNCNVAVSDSRLSVSDGEFRVSYLNDDAFRVRHDGVFSYRDTTVRGNVESFGSMRVTPSSDLDPEEEVSFRVTSDFVRVTNVDLNVRGAGLDVLSRSPFIQLTEDNSLMPPDARLVFRADATDGMLINRETEIRSDLKVNDGSVVFRYDSSSDADEPGFVYDAHGIRINEDLSIRGGGDVRIEGGSFKTFPGTVEEEDVAFSVSNPSVLVNRDMVVNSNLLVKDDLVLRGGGLEVEPIAGEGTAFSVNDTEISSFRDLNVYDSIFSVVGESSESFFSVGEQKGMEVYKRVLVGSNSDLTLSGGGDLFVKDGGIFEVEDVFTVEPGEVTVRADMNVRNSNTKVSVNASFEVGHVRHDSSINEHDVLMRLHDSGVQFHRDTSLSCNLAVGGDIAIQGSVTSAEFTLENDFTVGGYTDLNGPLKVTPNGSTSDDVYTLSVQPDSVEVRGDVAVSCNLDVGGEATFRDGRLTVLSPLSKYLFEVNEGETRVYNDVLRLDADARVERDLDVLGRLEVNTVSTFDGTPLPPAIYVDNNDINLNRRVNLKGEGVDFSLNNDFVIRDIADGNERARFGEYSFGLHRDVELSCNLRIVGDTVFENPVTFNVGDASQQNGTDPALEILDDRVTINRDLYIRGGRDVRVFGGTNELFGDLVVNPDQAILPVLNVVATRVDVNRGLDVVGKTRLKNDTDVNSNLTVRGRTTLTNPLIVKAGGSPTGPDTLGVTSDLAKIRARLEVTDSIEALGNARFAGDEFDVAISGGSIAAFHLDASSAVLRRPVDITSNLQVRGDFDVFGNFAVGRDDDVSLVIDSDLVKINDRDLELDGSLTVRDADTVLNGDLLVSPGGAQVMVVDGNEVTINRPVGIDGDTSISGDLVVTHDVGGTALQVREGVVEVGRNVSISSNLTVLRNSDMRGSLRVRPTNSSRDALNVDDLRVRINRNLELDNGLRVTGRTDFQSPLRVNLDGYVAAEVERSGISLNRDVNITSNLHVTSRTELTGELLVNPGQTNIFQVSSSKIEAFRNVRLNGDLNITGQINTVSDARLKHNLRPIRGALDKIDRLQGYVYNMRDGTGTHDERDGCDERVTDRVGFVAQEVMEIVPEVVHPINIDPESCGHDGTSDRFYGIAYSDMVALLAEGIKELREENVRIGARLSELEEK